MSVKLYPIVVSLCVLTENSDSQRSLRRRNVNPVKHRPLNNRGDANTLKVRYKTFRNLRIAVDVSDANKLAVWDVSEWIDTTTAWMV